MRPRDRASAFFGSTALTVAILVVGGVLRWTQGLVALLVALSLAPQLLSRRALDRISPLVAVLGAASVLCAIQLVPLPAAILDALNPTGNALRDDGAALLDVSPWRAITLDAPGTLAALVFFVTLLGVAVAALRIATSERGRFYLIGTVTALCGLTAFVVVVHELFALDTLYGLYEPDYKPHLLGPLLNANHLGCLMAVGTVSSIGLVMYRQQASWARVVWVITMLGCAVATVATVSRGATIAVVLGSAVTLGLVVGQKLVGTESSRRRRTRFLTRSLPIGIVASCTVFVVVLINASSVEDQLERTTLQEIDAPTSKFAAWRSAATLAEETPWVGLGRGAFESSFTRVHAASAFATSSHLENEYLQAVVDWGVPGAIALGLLVLWLVFVAAKRWRDGPLTASAMGALVVVALQSNFDFGIELLGIAAPTTAIVATLVYVPLRERQGTRLAWTRALRLAHIAALLGGAALLQTDLTSTIDDDHRVLADNDATIEDVRAAVERHPLDYFAYARAATTMIKTRDKRAITMLNHAMRLHPTHPGLHAMAGRLLVGAGLVDQAAIEFAAALRSTRQPQKLITEIVERFPKDKAAAAIPVDAHLDSVIQTLRQLDRTDVATIWLTRILAAGMRDVHACEQLYQVAIRDNDLEAAELAGRKCVELVPDRAMRLSLARVLFKKQNFAEVIRLVDDVDQWHGKIEDKVSAWMLRCDSLEALGKLEDTKRCLRQLDLSGYHAARRGEITQRLERIEKQRRDEALGVPKLLEKYVKPRTQVPAPAGSGSAAGSSAAGSAAGSAL